MTFEGHRIDDDSPWIEGVGDAPGVQNTFGVAALADRFEALMTAGTPPEDVVAASAEVVLVIGTTIEDAPVIDALGAAADAWFEQLTLADLEPSIAVVAMLPSPAQEVDPDDDGPIADDSSPLEEGTDDGAVADDSSPVEETVNSPLQDHDDSPAVEPPPIPAFATTAAELRQKLTAQVTTEGVTTFASLNNALSVAIDMFTPSVTNTEVVILANNLDFAQLTAEESDRDRKSVV